jgi:hypothetical protein
MLVEGNPLAKSGKARPILIIKEVKIHEHNRHASRSTKWIGSDLLTIADALQCQLQTENAGLVHR